MLVLRLIVITKSEVNRAVAQRGDTERSAGRAATRFRKGEDYTLARATRYHAIHGRGGMWQRNNIAPTHEPQRAPTRCCAVAPLRRCK